MVILICELPSALADTLVLTQRVHDMQLSCNINLAQSIALIYPGVWCGPRLQAAKIKIAMMQMWKIKKHALPLDGL